jgi:hypothetical protein
MARSASITSAKLAQSILIVDNHAQRVLDLDLRSGFFSRQPIDAAKIAGL